jgi:hypothetical protein
VKPAACAHLTAALRDHVARISCTRRRQASRRARCRDLARLPHALPPADRNPIADLPIDPFTVGDYKPIIDVPSGGIELSYVWDRL